MEIDIFRKKHIYTFQDVCKTFNILPAEVVQLINSGDLVPDANSESIDMDFHERIAKQRMFFTLEAIQECIGKIIRSYIQGQNQNRILDQIFQQNSEILTKITKIDVNINDFEPLTTADVARLLHKSQGTVQNACKRGQTFLDIPGFRKVEIQKRGKNYHIDKRQFMYHYNKKDYAGFHAKLKADDSHDSNTEKTPENGNTENILQ